MVPFREHTLNPAEGRRDDLGHVASYGEGLASQSLSDSLLPVHPTCSAVKCLQMAMLNRHSQLQASKAHFVSSIRFIMLKPQHNAVPAFQPAPARLLNNAFKHDYYSRLAFVSSKTGQGVMQGSQPMCSSIATSCASSHSRSAPAPPARNAQSCCVLGQRRMPPRTHDACARAGMPLKREKEARCAPRAARGWEWDSSRVLCFFVSGHLALETLEQVSAGGQGRG